jgi:hypothetical protein
VTYVDDVLAVGEEGVLDGFCTRMQQEWEVCSPDWLREDGPPVRFLGMEIELRKGVYRVHQQSYIQSLLENTQKRKAWDCPTSKLLRRRIMSLHKRFN